MITSTTTGEGYSVSMDRDVDGNKSVTASHRVTWPDGTQGQMHMGSRKFAAEDWQRAVWYFDHLVTLYRQGVTP